jgi:hypothetical protein
VSDDPEAARSEVTVACSPSLWRPLTASARSRPKTTAGLDRHGGGRIVTTVPVPTATYRRSWVTHARPHPGRGPRLPPELRRPGSDVARAQGTWFPSPSRSSPKLERASRSRSGPFGPSTLSDEPRRATDALRSAWIAQGQLSRPIVRRPHPATAGSERGCPVPSSRTHRRSGNEPRRESRTCRPRPWCHVRA